MPDLGVGVGFRVPHYKQIAEARPPMDWFEVISENFMVDGGSPLYHLDRLREVYPVVPHGVSLSVGSELDAEHLGRLRALVERIRPKWASDHLCFTRAGGVDSHDLLPLPYTPEMVQQVVDNVRRVQDLLQLPFAIENVSSYLSYRASVMPEWDFLGEVAERADCALLLDVNNVFVSAVNHGFDPEVYIDAVPADRVVQMHLAGHEVQPEGYRLDTHDHPVCDEVWALYRRALARTGPVSVLIEWDDHIPSFERLSEEAATARRIKDEVCGGR